MLNHNMKDLGVFVSMFAEAGYLEYAQECLNELQERLNTVREMKGVSTAAKITRQMRANDLLVELPMIETEEPTLKHKTLVELAKENKEETAPAVAAINEAHAVAEPEPGIIRDKDGKVTHVSVQAGNPGYDPDIHENTALKIYCDGKHIETAHTADTVAGSVLYYKKNERGRIKTLELHGEVEIEGVN